MTTLFSASGARLAATAPYRPFGALRFLLALMVLVQHALLLLPEISRQVFYGLELGAVAVAVFFALSGFVGAEAVTCFYAGRPAAFLANRALRILPLYLTCFGLTAGMACWFYARGSLEALDEPLSGAPWQPAVLLSGLLDIVPGLPAHRVSGQGFAFIPFAWTLRIEVLFYLCAGLWCAWRWRRPGALALNSLAYGLFVVFVWRHGELPQQLLCIPFFAFGINAYALGNAGRAGALNVIALLGCAMLGFTYWGQRGHPHLAFQVPLLAALLGLCLLLAKTNFAKRALLTWDRRLGALSYPLYIGHGLVLLALRSASPCRGWDMYAAGIIASLCLAVLLNLAVERPLCALRARVRGRSL